MDPPVVVSRRVNLKHQLFGVWAAPIFTVLTVVGFFLIAHFWQPAPADLSPQAAAKWFGSSHREGVLLGMSIWIIGACVMAFFVAQLYSMLAELEGRRSVMAMTQLIAGCAIVTIVIIDASLWMGASYRPGANGEIDQALSDAAWLSLLIAWPILSVEMVASALVTIQDKRERPLVPRWVSIASLVGAGLLFTAGGPAFAKHGIFSYQGALGYYVPFIIWALWLNGHAVYMRRSVRHQQKDLAATEAEHRLRPVMPALPGVDREPQAGVS